MVRRRGRSSPCEPREQEGLGGSSGGLWQPGSRSRRRLRRPDAARSVSRRGAAVDAQPSRHTLDAVLPRYTRSLMLALRRSSSMIVTAGTRIQAELRAPTVALASYRGGSRRTSLPWPRRGRRPPGLRQWFSTQPVAAEAKTPCSGVSANALLGRRARIRTGAPARHPLSRPRSTAAHRWTGDYAKSVNMYLRI